MSEIRERVIPCADCEDWKADLELRGFSVLNCKPDAAKAGFCRIRFQDNPLAASPTPAVGPLAITPDVAPIVASANVAASAELQKSSTAVLTELQKSTAESIINIFETGEVLGDYSCVTVISGDTGHLTFGRSQTTLGSGNLYDMLNRYCSNVGAKFGPRIRPFLERVKQKNIALDTDQQFQNLLRASADDPVMRGVQDSFFDEAYWQPAEKEATRLKISSPLGVAVVYDSFVHGSWHMLRDKVNKDFGTIDTQGERNWVSQYVSVRRDWLSNHVRPDIRLTSYRMDAFARLISQSFWGLDLPIAVHGQEISIATLNGQPPNCYDGPQPGTRRLEMLMPFMRGLDVRLVQLALSDVGVDIKADGIFGRTSSDRVKDFQREKGLPTTGVLSPDLIAQLVV